MENWKISWLDYYEILNIERSATPDEIKKNYIKLMKEIHPDLHSKESNEFIKECEEKSKLLNEAYGVLSDNELKAEYDREWDARKSGNFSEYYTENTDIKYEDVEAQYSEQEKKLAKQTALKQIIEEELNKSKIITDTKAEILYCAYLSDIDKKEYYKKVKELINASNEYISSLNELADEAYNLDLLMEQELINDTIEYLRKELNEIPLSPNDAKVFIGHEVNKETTSNKINEYIFFSNELINDINMLLIQTSKGEIDIITFNNMLNKLLLDVTTTISHLEELSKIANKLDLEEEINKCINTLGLLKGTLLITPKEYAIAQKVGELVNIKRQIQEKEDEYKLTKEKSKKIMHIISRHPGNRRCPKLYEHAKELLNNLLNEITYIEKRRNVVRISEKIDYNDLIIKAMGNYNDAEKLHIDINKQFTTIEDSYLNLDEIFEMAKNSLNIIEKKKALELIMEAKEIQIMSDKIKEYENSMTNLSFGELINQINTDLNELNKFYTDIKVRESSSKDEIANKILNCEHRQQECFYKSSVLSFLILTFSFISLMSILEIIVGEKDMSTDNQLFFSISFMGLPVTIGEYIINLKEKKKLIEEEKKLRKEYKKRLKK